MKKTITLLAIYLIVTFSFAQSPALQWQKALGGTNEDFANDIQTTPDGGYIVAGYTYSTDGDATGNHGAADAWVVKLGATGAVEWQKALGGTGFDYANSIHPTPDGGYIMAGETNSLNGDVTINYGFSDAWVVKLSATGAIVWQKVLGGTSAEKAESIQFTTDGGYIMAGITYSNNGDVTGNHGDYDAWVVKLAATGVIEWQKTLGGTSADYANSIQTTPDGGYIVAGYTRSTNGDVSGNHGVYDAWVMKLAATGALVWQKTLGGTIEDYAFSIQPSTDGGYIVAGYTQSTNGDITGNHGNADAWIVKLSSTGSLMWQKALGGTNNDYAGSIQTTPDGGYIVAGLTYSTDGDVTGNHGGSDSWVVKLNTMGALVWQKALGGTNDDGAGSIQTTPDGGYIIASQTNSNNGDVTGNLGGPDAWVVKLAPELSTTGFVKDIVTLYPNPAKDLITLTFTETPSPFEVSITDGLGKTVFSQTYSAQNNVNIATASFSKGVYFLSVSNQEKKQTQKLIID